MGVMNKIWGFIGLSDEDEMVDRDRERYEEEHEEEAAEPVQETGRKAKPNVVSLHAHKQVKVVLSEPRSYDEAQEIADHLKSRRQVIVNLQRVRPDHALRIVDFLSGTVYALNGQISKIGANIFLCTPDSVEISGAITEMFQEHQEYK